MAALAFPIEVSTPHQEFSMDLEGVNYIFEFRWNGRDSAWYMSVFDIQGSPILQSAKVALGAIIGQRVSDDRFPPGAIYAADLSGAHQEAGLDDLGDRVQVYYLETVSA